MYADSRFVRVVKNQDLSTLVKVDRIYTVGNVNERCLAGACGPQCLVFYLLSSAVLRKVAYPTQCGCRPHMVVRVCMWSLFKADLNVFSFLKNVARYYYCST